MAWACGRTGCRPQKPGVDGAILAVSGTFLRQNAKRWKAGEFHAAKVANSCIEPVVVV
jgi:hypothetical protein